MPTQTPHLDDERPDPDTLLRRTINEEERAQRSKLKIFFGFAPGVGKTYAMLEEAQRLYKDGVRVVIGCVETHGRQETARLVGGLPKIPLKKLNYRGRSIDEFDLDTALQQKPDLLLLDELAHSNAPSSRHPYRWQDVEELLQAGIDVYTTLNVQHVASLNDVVAQITHVQVRETVPDAILDRADDIELIDISPETLLERLHDGKVYVPEQIERASQHFFRRGNLLALRELALRRTAERVDAEVRAYREENEIEETWQTTERILVCIDASPHSAKLVRAARRLADAQRAPWAVVYVEPLAAGVLSETARAQLDAHFRLAESLGGALVHLSGPSVADAILTYARKHNITKILVGKPISPQWRDWLPGSLLLKLVRGSGNIDIQVISGETPHQLSEDVGKLYIRTSSATNPALYVWSFLLTLLTTLLAATAFYILNLPDIEMLYIVAVMLSALYLGRAPAVATAFFSVAAYDFFFVPPYFTFAVADGRYFLTFIMLFGVGLVVSTLASRIRRQEQQAVLREERTAALYEMSRALGAAQGVSDVMDIAAKQVYAFLQTPVRILSTSSLSAPQQKHASTEEIKHGVFCCSMFPMPVQLPIQHADSTNEARALYTDLESSDYAVAKWALEHGRAAGAGTDTLPGAKILCIPLGSRDDSATLPTSVHNGIQRVSYPVPYVLALSQPRQESSLFFDNTLRTLLDALCRQIAFALERAQFAEDARAALLRAQTETMRSALLSAVSHDMRTPLAAITGAASTLRDQQSQKILQEETKEDLLATICEESERMERLIENLLNMTRLDAGNLVLQRDWVPVDEIIGAVLTQREDRLQDRPINVEIRESIAGQSVLIDADSVLLEEILLNLLDNALKYTPPQSPITITAYAQDPEQMPIYDAGAVVIEVADRGMGIAQGEEERIFEKFYRSPAAHPQHNDGVGLGLSICRAAAHAHGGTATVHAREGGGAIFRIVIPHRELPPLPMVDMSAPVPAQDS